MVASNLFREEETGCSCKEFHTTLDQETVLSQRIVSTRDHIIVSVRH